MNDVDYFALEALSQSGAKDLLISPALYRANRDAPSSDNPAFALGRLLHALVLTPDAVPSLFSTGPDLSKLCDPKTGQPYKVPAMSSAGKDLIAKWTAENPGVQVVPAADWQNALEMSWALLDSTMPTTTLTLRQLLQQQTVLTEIAVVWTDEATGAQCKAKPDLLVVLPDGRAVCVDLKTTAAEFSAASLSRAAVSYGYHRQAAHYLAALANQGQNDCEFWFAFVGKSNPHEVAWLKPSDAMLAAGAAEMLAAKTIYAACVQANSWPSAQAAGLLGHDLDLPRWYKTDDGE